MIAHLENSVKDEILHTREERISPIPSVVLDDSMGINLDPEVEQHERSPADPSKNMEDEGMTGRELQQGKGEETVGEEVVEEDDIDEMTEHDPHLRTSEMSANANKESYEIATKGRREEMEAYVKLERDSLMIYSAVS